MSRKKQPILLDDDDLADLMPARGKRSATSASKAARNGRSDAPKEKKSRVSKQTLCCYPGCIENSNGGKPGCSDHNKLWEQLRYRFAKLKDEGDTESWTLWLEMQEAPNRTQLGEEMYTQGQNNPTDSRWKAKALLDKAAFQRRWGKKTARIADLKNKPYTKKAFEIRCTTKLGLSLEEAKDWWEQHLEDPAVPRDNSGYRCQLTLYQPCGMEHRRRKEVSTEANAM